MIDRYARGVDFPAWYTLQTDGKSIALAIHKTAAPTRDSFNQAHVAWTQTELVLPEEFSPPNADKKWGFGEVVAEEPSPNPNWALYTVDLPVRLLEDDTYWQTLFATSATLSELFRHLYLFEENTQAPFPQRTIVQMTTGKNGLSHVASISAELRPSLVNWITQNADMADKNNITETMQQAYNTMRGVDATYSPDPYHFRVFVNDSTKIHLSVPGDACGLDPDYYARDDGYELYPHNVDTPLQQLTLLAGLAKLDELARGDDTVF